MFKKDPTVEVAGTRTIITIHSLADALLMQRNIADSIAMALADGQDGYTNGVPTDGDTNNVRFHVHISAAEASLIGFYAKQKG